MKVLAIDTSSNVAAAAVVCDGRLTGEYILNHRKTHSQKIMPMIDELMKSAELDISEIDLFAAVTGPGSFTGLRIGAAAIKGLAQALGKPVAAVNTLEALAYNLPFCRHLVVPMIDARRRDVYAAVYGEELRCEAEPFADEVDRCVEIVKRTGRTAVFLGDGAIIHRDFIVSELGDKAFFAPVNLNEQRASSAAMCALDKYARGEIMSCGELEPFYLRKSQAEREYDEKNK